MVIQFAILRKILTSSIAMCLCAIASLWLDWLSISNRGAKLTIFVSLYLPRPCCTAIPMLYTLKQQ
jgi:hypothetical protein